MKSNLGLGIHFKHIGSIQSKKPFSHCGVALCTYPFLPTSFLSCNFVQTVPHHILVKCYRTCYVIRTWRNNAYLQCAEPVFNCQENNKGQNQGWMEERARGQVVIYSLINILDWFMLQCQKQMCHLPFKDSTSNSTRGFMAACIMCHSSSCILTIALFVQMWRKSVYKMWLITWCTGFVGVL